MQIKGLCILFYITILNCIQPPNTLSAKASAHSINNQIPQFTGNINTAKINPAELIAFAESLIGTAYKYGSANPNDGFDCSGFITYVFNHFNIAVPRSSVDFTFINREINLNVAKTGDLILFTGTNNTIRTVGHMGILIVKPNEPVKFIHSTSGKAYGVTETPLNDYYMGRYVKTIRVFLQ